MEKSDNVIKMWCGCVWKRNDEKDEYERIVQCEKCKPKPSMTLADIYEWRMRIIEKAVETVEELKK